MVLGTVHTYHTRLESANSRLYRYPLPPICLLYFRMHFWKMLGGYKSGREVGQNLRKGYGGLKKCINNTKQNNYTISKDRKTFQNALTNFVCYAVFPDPTPPPPLSAISRL